METRRLLKGLYIAIAFSGILFTLFAAAALGKQAGSLKGQNHSPFAAETTHSRSCTIITAVSDDQVLFANNEDHSEPDVVIGFQPRSDAGYGSVHLGYRIDGRGIGYEGAMNEYGLAWDINSLPATDLNPHPERPYSHVVDNYLTQITKGAKTVAEAVALANEFDFGPKIHYQIHIADASGDAAVISSGPDGELAFTRRDPEASYLVSANANLANPRNSNPFTGTLDRRYERASGMMDKIDKGEAELSTEYLASVLDEVHMEFPGSYTVYSNIFDLQNQVLHLVYLTRFDEMITLDLEHELSLGEHVYEASDLFDEDTVNSGMRDFQAAEVRGRIILIGAALAVAAVVIFCLRSLIRRVRRGSIRERKERQRSAFDLTGG